jgi:hypothetical protein
MKETIKMKRFFRLFSRIIQTFFFSFFLFACDSPILNHSNAEDSARLPLIGSLESCPLRFEKQSLCASWTWDRIPTTSEFGTAQLRFWSIRDGSENGPFIDPGHSIEIKPWMPSMGHGTPVKASVIQAKDSGGQIVPGVFEATQISVFMKGKWEIWVQLKNGNEILEQMKLDFLL